MPTKLERYDNFDPTRGGTVDAQLALANSNPLLLARGGIMGTKVVHKYGYNLAVASSEWEGVQALSGVFPWLQAASAIRVKAGGDAADDGASSPLGAGAHSVTVEGLDATGAEQLVTITTKGASASDDTTETFTRVHRAYVNECGTYGGNNTAAITISSATSPETDLIVIPAGEGQTQHCGYTIPLGYTGYLWGAIVQVDGNKQGNFRLMARSNALDFTAPFSPAQVKFYWDGVSGQQALGPYTPVIELPALTDVWLDAYGDGGAIEAVGDLEIVLFDR